MNDEEFSKRIVQSLDNSLDTVDEADLARLRKARQAALTQDSITTATNTAASISAKAAASKSSPSETKASEVTASKTPTYAIAASLTAVALVTLLMLNPNKNMVDNNNLTDNNAVENESGYSSSLAIESDDPEMLLELEFLETIDMLAALSDIGEDINPSFEFSTDISGGSSDDLQVM